MKSDITLTGENTDGRVRRWRSGEDVEITRVLPTKLMGVDGFESVGHHPARVRWYGGSAALFAAIDRVVIIDTKTQGTMQRLYGPVTRTFIAPRDISGGVEFEVLEEFPGPAA